MPRENGSNEKKPKPKNRIESNVNYEMDKQDDTQWLCESVVVTQKVHLISKMTQKL